MKYVRNPLVTPRLNSTRDTEDIVVSSPDGNVRFLSVTKSPGPDVLQIDTKNSRKISRADREVEGTAEKTYTKEGLVTNPGMTFPGAFFSPIPPVVRGMLAGPLSLIDNPALIIGLIVVVAGSSSADKKDKYTTHYNTLPDQVLDNQELEDQFFGGDDV
jgi:hypothetical protein